jgi:hypothetical protein
MARGTRELVEVDGLTSGKLRFTALKLAFDGASSTQQADLSLAQVVDAAEVLRMIGAQIGEAAAPHGVTRSRR